LHCSEMSMQEIVENGSRREYNAGGLPLTCRRMREPAVSAGNPQRSTETRYQRWLT
jgi:hypothetical protein